jgi:hypothetical protein
VVKNGTGALTNAWLGSNNFRLYRPGSFPCIERFVDAARLLPYYPVVPKDIVFSLLKQKKPLHMQRL